jgi:hypothetical protein
MSGVQKGECFPPASFGAPLAGNGRPLASWVTRGCVGGHHDKTIVGSDFVNGTPLTAKRQPAAPRVRLRAQLTGNRGPTASAIGRQPVIATSDVAGSDTIKLRHDVARLQPRRGRHLSFRAGPWCRMFIRKGWRAPFWGRARHPSSYSGQHAGVADISNGSFGLTPYRPIAGLVIVPVAWVAAFSTGPRGKSARKVLSMILRRPPK